MRWTIFTGRITNFLIAKTGTFQVIDSQVLKMFTIFNSKTCNQKVVKFSKIFLNEITSKMPLNSFGCWYFVIIIQNLTHFVLGLRWVWPFPVVFWVSVEIYRETFALVEMKMRALLTKSYGNNVRNSLPNSLPLSILVWTTLLDAIMALMRNDNVVKFIVI